MSDPIPTSAALADKRKSEVRSQACSPTMTWLNDSSVVEEISVISLSTDLPPSEPQTLQLSLPREVPSEHLDSVDSSINLEAKDQTKITVATPQTTQPHSSAPLLDKHESTEETAEDDTERAPPQRRHWSRYFLVDLLALAMPVSRRWPGCAEGLRGKTCPCTTSGRCSEVAAPWPFTRSGDRAQAETEEARPAVKTGQRRHQKREVLSCMYLAAGRTCTSSICFCTSSYFYL
ncbi:hypothetical protein WMY93_031427 [Mugilogobius chulae]|uniref:Uncharacterized protein n=1 Tax=Mugilogobius chulae TaxID=88201 RepID=A0AAW0MDL7_9GOBI